MALHVACCWTAKDGLLFASLAWLFNDFVSNSMCEVTLQSSFSSHSHTRSTKRWRVDKHASLELKAPIFCIKIQTHHTSLILKWLRIPWYFISIFYGVYFTVANSFFWFIVTVQHHFPVNISLISTDLPYFLHDIDGQPSQMTKGLVLLT